MKNLFSNLSFVRSLVLLVAFVSHSITAAAEAPESVVGAKTIGISQALELYHHGAVFIDVRDEAAWSYGHIDGAVHLDFNEDEFVILYVSDALDKSTPIVFYCDSPLSTSGAMASFFASSWGYKNVYYYRDGYYSWLASDLPMQLQDAHVEGHVAETETEQVITVAEKRL